MQPPRWLALLTLCTVLAACEWAPHPETAGTASGASPADPEPAFTPSRAESHATRPAYNTGRGLFVSDGRLYDGNGNEFRIRGVNRAHYDSGSQPGMSRAGVNAVRMFLYSTSLDAQTYLRVLETQHLANKEVAIPAIGPGGTCEKDPRELAAGVDWWLDNVKVFSQIDKASIINIANEWGPPSSIIWRDAYIIAVKKMRAAGYRAPLMIDSGGCGQDINDLLNYAAAVFEADPQRNLIFSFHLYGATAVADIPAVFARLGDLQKRSGAVFVIGEFGPGRDIGPSPTQATPQQVIAAAETNDLGWLAWAWDDNNLADCQADDNWFSMTRGCGGYVVPSDLTSFGRILVLDPRYSFQALARPASIF